MEPSSLEGVKEKAHDKTHHDEGYVWQDKEIRFDTSPSDLELRKGEVILDALDEIEDAKGGKKDKGELLATNLRILWMSAAKKNVSISIGYDCVTSLNVRNSAVRTEGEAEHLIVRTRYNGQQFEFVFANQSKSSVFSKFQGVSRAYEMSRMYRELRLRGAIIQEGELKLLAREDIYSKVNGVWNLSSEQGNLGTFFITNVRVVWFANLNEGFNVSIPYLQVKNVRVRDSKFGPALVVETVPRSGGYVLGFKIDPRETLDYVFKEISSLWQTYSARPIFGIEYNLDDPSVVRTTISKDQNITKAEEDVEIIDAGSRGDVLASYAVDASKAADREPMYHPDLGLAIEALHSGVTIDVLWSPF